MYTVDQLIFKLTTIDTQTFEEVAFELFYFQYNNNLFYKNFCDSRKKNPRNCKNLIEIPHLPIDFFKEYELKSGHWPSEHIFKSSGTTLQNRSNHHVWSIEFYKEISKINFFLFYKKDKIKNLIALLPSYQTNLHSSLLTMVDHLMLNISNASRYYNPNEFEEISQMLKNEPDTLLLGVTFALLDLADKIEPFESDAFIMETGGMKGKRKEIIREEVHFSLLKTLHVKNIHSEYGMTELFSQAYAKEKGIFYWPPWAKSWVRQIQDPFTEESSSHIGGLNIIDLANWYTVAFIETQDLGRIHKNGGLEILGRMDNSEVRGCNLLIY